MSYCEGSDYYSDVWREEEVEQIYEAFQDSHTGIKEEHNRLAFRELQSRLANVDHWQNFPLVVMGTFVDQHYKVDKAEAKFLKIVEWRKKENIDELVNWRPDPVMWNYFPMTFLRDCDRQGDPIWLSRIGVADILGLYKRFGTEEMVKFILFGPEQALRGAYSQEYRRRFGKRSKKITIVIDLEGMNSRHIRPCLIPILKQVVRMLQDRYCGLCKKIVILRAPSVFKVIWGLINGLIDENFRKLVLITSHTDYLEVLEKYVNLSVMPREICDQGRGIAGPNLPWRFEGGLVPAVGKEDEEFRDYDMDKFLHSSSFVTDTSDSTVEQLDEPLFISCRSLGSGEIMISDDGSMSSVSPRSVW